MKKSFVLILTLLAALFLAACQEAPEAKPEPTPATTEVIAESPSPAADPTPSPTTADDGRFRAEASLAENSTTVSFETFKEYQDALHEMGFTEYLGDAYRPTFNSGVVYRPFRLTYNDQVFKLEFDVRDFANPNESKNLMGELKTTKGWILYGMKNAAGPINVTDYNAADFDEVGSWDSIDVAPEMATTFFRCVDTMFCNLDGIYPSQLVYLAQYYFLQNGNLYNLTYDMEDPLATLNIPEVVCTHENAEGYPDYKFEENPKWEITIPEGVTELYGLDLFLGENKEHCIESYYEPGMTVLEWLKSPYTTESDWVIFEDGRTIAYRPYGWNPESDGLYCIANADRPIEELVTVPEYERNYINLQTPEEMGLTMVTG